MLEANFKLPFREWAGKDFTHPDLSNSQTRFIAGDLDFEHVIDIIENDYFFVGTLELFDESLLMLNRMLGGRLDIRFEKLRTSKRDKKEILDDPQNEEVLDKLRYYNEVDYKLIEYVKNTLFSKYAEQYGVLKDNEIEAFRAINRGFTFPKSRTWPFKAAKYLYYENIFRLKRIV
jgi:hypothetical protein